MWLLDVHLTIPVFYLYRKFAINLLEQHVGQQRQVFVIYLIY